MPQSLAQIWLHIVFSTKERRPFLRDDEIREEMFRMLSHHVGKVGCHPLKSGGWHDHVHVVCGLGRTISVAKLVEEIKTETSKWAKDRSPALATFTWQAGYGAFSVSQSNVPQVLTYVEHQPDHHRDVSYQDEFRKLCLLHQLPIDERYVWD
jgi:putative transposase